MTKRFLLPPGYTQMPNILFDEILPVAGHAEWKVTCAIARKTFGWHEPMRLLSNADLRALTGLSRQAVTDGLKAGEERGFLAKRNMGGNRWAYGIAVKNPDSSPSPQLPSNQEVDFLASRKSSIQEKQTPSGENKRMGADAPSSAKEGDIKGKPGQTFKPVDGDRVHQVIVELFDFWIANTPQPPGTTLTVKRAQQIKARMREQAEGCDRETALATARERMLEAMQGWVTSPWHLEREAFDFDVLFRSRKKVEKFRGDFFRQQQAQEKAKASGGGFADYGGVVERG